jgi:hypothetical protein
MWPTIALGFQDQNVVSITVNRICFLRQLYRILAFSNCQGDHLRQYGHHVFQFYWLGFLFFLVCSTRFPIFGEHEIAGPCDDMTVLILSHSYYLIHGSIDIISHSDDRYYTLVMLTPP